MILALLTFLGCCGYSFFDNTLVNTANYETKFSLIITLGIMILHKVESYLTKEWEECRFYNALKKINILQQHGEIVFLVFVTTFILLMSLMTLIVCNEKWIKYSLLIWAGQLLNETHHLSKSFMYSRYYTGSYSAFIMVLLAIFDFCPVLSINYGYSYNFGMYSAMMVSSISFVIFCIEVKDVKKRKFHSILITGGGRGIGAELAKLYSKEKATIFICGRDKDPLEKIKLQGEKLGGNIITKVVDISNKIDLETFINESNKTEPLDLLLCNACTKGSLQKQCDVNLIGTVNTLNKGLDIMKPNTTIGVMSTLGIFQKTPYEHFYMSVKKALYHYTESVMAVGKNKKIKVVPICPGMARDKKDIFTMTYSEAAENIYYGLENQRDYIIFPFYQWFTLKIIETLPNFVIHFILINFVF